ncbi:MAG: lysozyme [Telluria sp.]
MLLAMMDELVALIKRYEGCKLTAYLCPAGVWTIGWGETRGVKPGMVWTQAQADEILRRRVAQFLLAVLKRCPELHLMPDCRAAACTSLAYNIGVGAFGASSVCRKTRRWDIEGAARSFLLWNKAGGRVLRGLTRRREAERALYLREGV